MDLKTFLSDPTLQKDEDNNILCRKIINGKTHHMKPAFCMSARLRSEGWEIVRKPEPPPHVRQTVNINMENGAVSNPSVAESKAIEGEIFNPIPLVTAAMENQLPALTPGVLIETENGAYKIDNPVEKVKPKRKYKARKTTTKRKRTVKNLTPETTNG